MVSRFLLRFQIPHLLRWPRHQDNIMQMIHVEAVSVHLHHLHPLARLCICCAVQLACAVTPRWLRAVN